MVTLSITAIGGRLPSPLPTARGLIDERRGWLLHASDGDGHVGIGEASPLRYFSRDSLDDARAALGTIDARALSLDGDLATMLANLPQLASPAAQHALETAMWSLWAARGQQPPTTTPRICALWPSDLDGATAVKMKIGADLTRERAALVELRRRWPDLELRLDANQQLSPALAADVLGGFVEFRPSLVEEPVQGGIRLAIGLPIPVAADETLRDDDTVIEDVALAAAVLKPMILGGPRRCLALAARARAQGIAVVVSHSFDGPVARSHALALAGLLPPPTLAAGLAPHAALAVLR